MIEHQGEHYLTVREVAERFRISRGLCYSNILAYVNTCSLPGRKHALYTQSDVEQFAEVRFVETVPWRALPPGFNRGPAVAETGSCVTSPLNIASRADPLSQHNPSKEQNHGRF